MRGTVADAPAHVQDCCLRTPHPSAALP